MNTDICYICWEPLGQNIYKTVCGHLIHSNCQIELFLHKRFDCGYCRKVLIEINQREPAITTKEYIIAGTIYTCYSIYLYKYVKTSTFNESLYTHLLAVFLPYVPIYGIARSQELFPSYRLSALLVPPIIFSGIVYGCKKYFN
jgi:hypothetical protein